MPAYLGGKVEKNNEKFRQGVNFAVGGATALDSAYLWDKGVTPSNNNVSLGTQLAWFKEMMSSFCKFPSGAYIVRSIIFFPMGGN